jgi:hypothetical protein
MKKTTVIILALFSILFSSNAQNYQWARIMGTVQTEVVASMVVDSFGNIYTIGNFEGTIDLDPGVGISNLTSEGEYDFFISKLNAAGNFIWAKRIGGADYDIGSSIAVDKFGNLHILGHFSGSVDFDPGVGTSNLVNVGASDAFVLKLDSAGNFIWVKSMGGISIVTSKSIGLDSAGNVYASGDYWETADFDPGPDTSNLTSLGSTDIFITKLDSAGNFIWAKSMGGGGIQYINCIAVDALGNVHTIGGFTGTIDLDPGGGSADFTSEGIEDFYISKMDESGNYLWGGSFGGMYDDFGTSIAVDNNGNVYTTGMCAMGADFDPGPEINFVSNSGYDVFILKLSAEGDFVWVKSIGGYDFDIGYDFAIDDSNNVYTTGSFKGTVDFDPGDLSNTVSNNGGSDIFILKLDSAGNFVWVKSLGGASSDYGRFISADNAGNVYTAGVFKETVDFDPGPGTYNLTSTGSNDIFILKLGSASVDIGEHSFENSLRAFPNPTTDALNIDLGSKYEEVDVLVKNQLGQTIMKKSFVNSNFLELNIPGAVGLYYIEVSMGAKKGVLKVVKE